MKNLTSSTINLNNSSAINKLILLLLIFVTISSQVKSQSNPISTKAIVPEWAWPGSPTRKQVPPPKDFHRVTITDNTPIGIFDGQSDIGAAIVPGFSSYDPTTKEYTITSAGYNIWYTRDEFRFLWKKMSGDVSLAADVRFPDSTAFFDRKAVVVIRQTLDDDSEGAVVARHGGGLMHLAWRAEKNDRMIQMLLPQKGAMRIGIEKQGAAYAIFLSMNGEPMQQIGYPIQLRFKEPLYVGIGFCSHIPDKLDTAILSNVVLENVAGEVR